MLVPTHPRSGLAHFTKWFAGVSCSYLLQAEAKNEVTNVWPWKEHTEVERFCAQCLRHAKWTVGWRVEVLREIGIEV